MIPKTDQDSKQEHREWRQKEPSFQRIIQLLRADADQRSAELHALVTDIYPTLKEAATAILSSRMHAPGSDPDDVVAEWFLQLLSGGFAGYRLGEPFFPFARQALINLCNSTTRRVWRRRECAYESDLRDDKCNPCHSTDLQETRQRVVRAVGFLPPDESHAIVSKYWKGHQAKSSAAEAKTTPQAIHNRLNRARGKLRDLLADLNPRNG